MNEPNRAKLGEFIAKVHKSLHKEIRVKVFVEVVIIIISVRRLPVKMVEYTPSDDQMGSTSNWSDSFTSNSQ